MTSSTSAAADPLEVYCALCQKDMRLVTGPNVAKGWYQCVEAKHDVIIRKAEAQQTDDTLSELRTQIEALIKVIDDDERSHYPSATTDENAVLALIQCNMEGKMDGLKECLKLAKAHLDRDRKMKAELANDINKALGMWSKTLRGLTPDRARLMGKSTHLTANIRSPARLVQRPAGPLAVSVIRYLIVPRTMSATARSSAATARAMNHSSSRSSALRSLGTPSNTARPQK